MTDNRAALAKLLDGSAIQAAALCLNRPPQSIDRSDKYRTETGAGETKSE